MAEENNQSELIFKAWEKTVDVQMHFNDLCLKVRSFAVSILGVLLGGAAISYRYGGDVNMWSVSFPVAAIFVSISIIIWLSFYSMDRYWYHELLRGAVKHGRLLEESLKSTVPDISLATSIRSASHASLNKNAASKLNWFYLTILGVQVVALVVVVCGAIAVKG
ncbi:hypothetical protein OQJ59_10190 [Microbulbifer thermotolerans]|uniref:hypothetical protein n=1 Tax=Microbulbifer thermotolerans TaxID=252514 RepID=UPI00224A90C7|nr:hypothetical protein [Microbulbifer thermotolerans]MCX2841988.1 hypothetical protein [Microbulbifer thermotolerans]